MRSPHETEALEALNTIDGPVALPETAQRMRRRTFLGLQVQAIATRRRQRHTSVAQMGQKMPWSSSEVLFAHSLLDSYYLLH